jgi:hypothetical protein
MQLQPEQRSRLLCRVIIFELSKFPFLSLFFLANFFEKGNTNQLTKKGKQYFIFLFKIALILLVPFEFEASDKRKSATNNVSTLDIKLITLVCPDDSCI